MRHSERTYTIIQVDVLLGINKDDGSETVMEEALAEAPKVMASRVARRDQELKVGAALSLILLVSATMGFRQHRRNAVTVRDK